MAHIYKREVWVGAQETAAGGLMAFCMPLWSSCHQRAICHKASALSEEVKTVICVSIACGS